MEFSILIQFIYFCLFFPVVVVSFSWCAGGRKKEKNVAVEQVTGKEFVTLVCGNNARPKWPLQGTVSNKKTPVVAVSRWCVW